MPNILNLPPEFRDALYQSWDPVKGLPGEAIRALLSRGDCTLGRIAQEAGVKQHYVQHVLSRTRRSAKVESCITRHLLLLGFTHDIIWGEAPPKRPSLRAVPEGFEGVPAFAGRLIRGQHEVALLVDCETSGPNAALHRPVEVAYLLVAFSSRPEDGYRLLGAVDGYTALQDPGPEPVNPISMRIHGIPVECLIGRQLDLRRIKRLVEMANLVIAHNAEFDHRFLAKVTPELDQRPWLCSYKGVDWKGHGLPSCRLTDLSKSLGLPLPKHRAPGDVVALYHLLDTRLPDGRTALAHLISSTHAC
jgi:DNA polymerase-3 subunit epsilon